jgi:hypothetical protein
MQLALFLDCANPKCRRPYPSIAHAEGKAVKVGRRCYCSKACKETHEDMMRRGEREEK